MVISKRIIFVSLVLSLLAIGCGEMYTALAAPPAGCTPGGACGVLTVDPSLGDKFFIIGDTAVDLATRFRMSSTVGFSLLGATSGTVSIKPAAIAGAWTMTLPTTDGDVNQFLQTDGAGITTWATSSGGAPTGAGYLTRTADSTLTAETDLSGLSTSDGYLKIANDGTPSVPSMLTVRTDIGAAEIGANSSITSMTAVTSITSSGSLALNAGGTNQNASLISSGTGIVVLKPGTNSTTAIQLQNAAGTNILNIDSTNNRVGIGTPAPGKKLSVQLSDAAGVDEFEVLDSGGVEVFSVDSDGNVLFAPCCTGTVNFNNSSTINFNDIDISDPGPGEGLGWNGTTGGWIVDVSPLDRVTNADGNLNLYNSSSNNIALWRPTLWVYNSTNYTTATAQSNGGLNFTTTGTGDITFSPGGKVGIGTTSPGTLLQLGTPGTTAGVLSLAGATSGTTTLNVAATASGTLTLPAATDTLVGRATTDTFTNKTYDTAGVGNSFKINGTSITGVVGTGLAVLATAPTFPTTITVGENGGATGAINLKGTTGGTVTVQPVDFTGTWTMTLPTAAGTSGQFLRTDGTGVTSWATSSGGGAPTGAGYLTTTADSTLTAETDLSGLSTSDGYLKIANDGTPSVPSMLTVRTDIGAAASGTNSDITSITGLTTPLAINEGGTASTTASAALAALGGANTQLSNLGTTAINESLVPDASLNLGAVSKPWQYLYIAGDSVSPNFDYFKITGVSDNGVLTINLPTPSGTSTTLVGNDTVDTLSNKTLTTPTIASFTNATHTHQNAAGGGQLNATSVFSAGTVPTARLGSGTASAATFLRGDQTWATPPSAYRTLVTLGADVINDDAVFNTMHDVTGLSFDVSAGTVYHFDCMIYYTTNATTTGSRWAINGPANPTALMYQSEYTLSASTSTRNPMVQAYDSPSGTNASSAADGNLAIISGYIKPSASGTVIVRFASEVISAAVTAKAGSTCEWW